MINLLPRVAFRLAVLNPDIETLSFRHRHLIPYTLYPIPIPFTLYLTPSHSLFLIPYSLFPIPLSQPQQNIPTGVGIIEERPPELVSIVQIILKDLRFWILKDIV